MWPVEAEAELLNYAHFDYMHSGYIFNGYSLRQALQP